jgi:hypothetical protein
MFASPLVIVDAFSDASAFQPFVTPTGTNATYYDGWSYDNSNDNIAYFMQGSGIYAGNPLSPGPLPFFGNVNGSAPQGFYFQTSSGNVNADLVMAVSSWSNINSLGWYDPYSSSWGWIFQGTNAAPIPHSVTFNPSSTFGLFFVAGETSYNTDKAYYSDATKNQTGDSYVQRVLTNNPSLGLTSVIDQHFTAFDNSGSGYYIGVNDNPLALSNGGDSDYQDLVFYLSEPTSVPEPGAFTFVLIGMVFFAVGMQRRRAASRT